MNEPRTQPENKRCICCNPSSLQNMLAGITRHRVVAYMRGASNEEIAQQRQFIEEFCKAHNYKIASAHSDCGDRPAIGLTHALEALNDADALIVSNLERLVTHHGTRLRDLRPLLHQFMCEDGKHLIAIAEGINSTTPSGQTVALEFMTQLKDAEDQEYWCT